MKRILSAITLILLLLFVSAQADELNIVTTIFPEYDFARAITGSSDNITMLLKPGAESHSYEPSPLDILTIQKCDVFICVGGENDKWAQKILDSIDQTNITVIHLMDIVTLREEEFSDSMQPEEGEETEYDEHVWTSPVNAALIVDSLAKEFIRLNPDHADIYRMNADDYIAEIGEIDAQFREVVSNAVRTELVFGDRFPFLYFTKEYGLTYDAAYPGCSTDTEASAATIAALINKVRTNKLPVIFYIELSSHKIAGTICEATGVKEVMLHSCHNVTNDDFINGETYVSLMKKNVEVLKEALCE